MAEILRVWTSRRRAALYLSWLIGAVGGASAWADEVPPPANSPTLDLSPLVVSATLLPTPRIELGSSVTVVTGEDIEKQQQRTLPEVLQDLPGLNVVQTGSPGGVTSVFIRGTNSNHTKVFIDGIDVSDPSSPNGAVDFSQFLSSNIDRVEVLRGPQSGLYGSDAIGGVINITTKTGEGPPRFRGSIEGGSFGTFNQTVGVGGSVARFSYNIDLSHYRSDDTQVTPTNLLVPGRRLNDDSYDNKTGAGKFGIQLTDNFDIGVVTRYTDTALHSTSDDFVGPEMLPSDSNNRELFTRGTAHLVLFDGVFEQTAGVAYTNYRRRFFDPNDPTTAPSFFRGDRVKLDWHGDIKLMPGQVLVLGAEHQRDTLNDSPPVTAAMSNNAGFVELRSSFGERFFNTVNVRVDDNDHFGQKTTFRAAPALLFPETGTKLNGSVGTGYKAPTLDELFDSLPQFGFFANPNLKPETSLGYDIGFEEAVLDKRATFGSTYFHNDIENLIDFNDTFTSYTNVGRATTYGAESFITVKPWETVTLRGEYTYTMATDDITHSELTRRPKHKASLNGAWQATEALSLSATVLYIGEWVDVNRSGSMSGLRSTPYALVNLAGSYDLGNGVTAFARINNALDRTYQDPIGFQHQGLGVFAGIKVAFNGPDLGR